MKKTSSLAVTLVIFLLMTGCGTGTTSSASGEEQFVQEVKAGAPHTNAVSNKKLIDLGVQICDTVKAGAKDGYSKDKVREIIMSGGVAGGFTQDEIGTIFDSANKHLCP